MARPLASAPLLSAEKITAHALELLDSEGIAALSIRKLASELGVSPKSLYHYFSTKDELLQGVYVRILQELELPDATTGTWQERFGYLARSLRRTMNRHAGFIGYYLHRHQISAEELDVYESLYTLLRQVGLPDNIVTVYGSVLVIFMVGFCYAEHNGNFSPDAFTQRGIMAQQQPERFPVALSLPLANSQQPPEAFFDIALNIMLAGISAAIPSTPNLAGNRL